MGEIVNFWVEQFLISSIATEATGLNSKTKLTRRKRRGHGQLVCPEFQVQNSITYAQNSNPRASQSQKPIWLWILRRIYIFQYIENWKL